MNQRLIGTIGEICRYPVKSFAGESLRQCRVEAYGLYGDRCRAFVDRSKEGWDRYVTARQYPGMLGYKAELVGEGSGTAFPELRVTSPDGRVLRWDEALRDELQPHFRAELSMLACEPGQPDLMAVDEGSVLIVTDVSLRKLERLWGKRLDPRRFRANLIVSPTDEAADETGWIGKTLIAGDAELQVEAACERCSMITIDPDRLERDASLLRIVNEMLDLNFGVYASVRKTGFLRAGDPVYMAGTG
ncbi:MOSC domain-containing protein [Paenibacillus sp. GYB003]|uniref:MOSC domain-containing protein n=1 Tax=Paenibacillus sp. GYB003 TaxID=2994392 RepID=UPI002F96E423